MSVVPLQGAAGRPLGTQIGPVRPRSCVSAVILGAPLAALPCHPPPAAQSSEPVHGKTDH